MVKGWTAAKAERWAAAVGAAREVLAGAFVAGDPPSGVLLDAAEGAAYEALGGEWPADEAAGLSRIAQSVALVDHVRAIGIIP